jgi:hypothetical protein
MRAQFAGCQHHILGHCIQGEQMQTAIIEGRCYMELVVWHWQLHNSTCQQQQQQQCQVLVPMDIEQTYWNNTGTICKGE